MGVVYESVPTIPFWHRIALWFVRGEWTCEENQYPDGTQWTQYIKTWRGRVYVLKSHRYY